MARIYCKRIMAGLMAIGDVPAPWRAKTQELLDAEQTSEQEGIL